MPAKPFYFEDWWLVLVLTALALIVLVLVTIGTLRSRRGPIGSGDNGGRGRGGRWLLGQSVRLIAGLASLAILVAGSLLLLHFHDYHNLVEWEVVGRVKCGPQAKSGMFPLHFTFLANGQDRATRVFEVYGDQWKIGADVVEWNAFMRHLGLTRSFRLARLDGLYDRERDYLERPVTIKRLGQGSDRVWVRFHKGQRPWPYRYFIRSVYTTDVSNIPVPDTLFDVVGQKQGLALRKVDY